MNRELEIVEKLVLGIDPVGRGEALRTPKDPALDKARAIYYEQLKRVCKQHAPAGAAHPAPAARPGESRAGERWTIAEDNRLTALWETSPTLTTAELADKLGRTRGAIIARLVRLGFFAEQQSAMLADNARLEALGQSAHWPALASPPAPAPLPRSDAETCANAGKPWQAADDQQLRDYWAVPAGLSCAEIARRLGRTPAAISARLVRIGILPDRDAVRAADRLRQEQ